MSRRWLQLLVLMGIAAALGWMGHAMHFGIFMLYDDEGYVLISLRNFAAHGGLYEKVYSQYGPAFYLAYDGLHRLLGFEWTNTSARWVTLFNWLGTAAFGTLILARMRLPTPLLVYGLVSIFTYLWIMIREPGHPGSLITLLVAAAAWAGGEAIRANRMVAFAVILGVAGALLSLVKVNVGAFLVLATLYWLLLSLEGIRSTPRLIALVGLGCLVSVALMRALLTEPWVLQFAGISCLAIASAVLAAAPAAIRPPARASILGWFICAGLGATMLVATLAVLRGTTVPGLWHGVFVAPLEHPTVYAFPVRWRPGALLVAAVAFGLVWMSYRQPAAARGIRLIAWIRVIAAVLFQLTLLPWFSTGQAAIGLSYGLPLAGLFACPLRPEINTVNPMQRASAWIALLLVFQSLQVFPVAGSQLSWGTWLWTPLMLLGLSEALEVLRPRGERLRFPAWPHWAASGAALALAGFMLWTLQGISRHYERDSIRLNLPGAERVGLPASIASALQVLTENARAHSDVHFSLPGAFSFNLWSGVRPPTLQNVTHWFSLLNESQQQEIIREMQRAPRSTFIVQHNILASLIAQEFRPGGPVVEYLRTSYYRAFSIEGYTFWVRNDQTIAALSTGIINQVAGVDPGLRQMQITLASHPGIINQMEIWEISSLPWRVLRLDSETSVVTATPLLENGAVAGPKHPVTWPFALRQTARLDILFRPLHPLPAGGKMQVLFLDTQGRRVAAARILSPGDFSRRAQPDAATAAAPPGAD